MYLPIGIGLIPGAPTGNVTPGVATDDQMLAALGTTGPSDAGDSLAGNFAALLTQLFTGSSTPTETDAGLPVKTEPEADEEASSDTCLCVDWANINPQLVPLVTEVAPFASITAVPTKATTSAELSPASLTVKASTTSQQTTANPVAILGEGAADGRKSSLNGDSFLEQADIQTPDPAIQVNDYATVSPVETLPEPIEMPAVIEGASPTDVNTTESGPDTPIEVKRLATSESTIADKAVDVTGNTTTIKPQEAGEPVQDTLPGNARVARDSLPRVASTERGTESLAQVPTPDITSDPSNAKNVTLSNDGAFNEVTAVMVTAVNEASGRDGQEGERESFPANQDVDVTLAESGGDLSRTDHIAPSKHEVASTKVVDDIQVVWQIVDAMKVAHDDPKMAHPRIEVELDPPELGRVSIELADTERGLSARIVVQRESTAQLVEQQLASIRQSLDQAGLHVRDFQLSHQGSSNGRGAFGSGGQHEMTRDQSGSGRRPRQELDSSSETTLRQVPKWRSSSRVDLRM